MVRLHTLHELDSSEGTVRLHSGADGHGALVLVPRPNGLDPNDPLRWPTWKKHVAFGTVCAFTFLANYAIGGMAPAFFIVSQQFHISMTTASELLLWPLLVFGVFNFMWVPLANYFGKRPIFVVACGCLFASYIWGALAQSFESLLWSSILGAFGGSATEALGAAIVNDLYFLHERGAKMGIYLNAIAGGNTIGPLICGFVVQGLGWRWHKWMAAIFVGVNWLMVIFFVPETRYFRDNNLEAAIPSGTETPSDQSSDLEKKRDYSPEATTNEVPKKTFIQELSLWSGVDKNNSLLILFIRPWPMIVYPSVIYAFLGYAVSLAWVVAVNILNSFVLQAPPYNWQPQINGLINIPGFLGNFFGAYAGGLCVDKFADWRTKKHGGVFQPETRLWFLIIPLLIVPAGCLAFGYGVQNTLNWTALFFGFGMINVGLTAVPTITMAYVSDCLLPVNADALELVNGLKNVVAFGFLYGVVPWVEEAGYVNCFGTQAGVYVAIILVFGLPLILFGEKIRHISARWRIIL